MKHWIYILFVVVLASCGGDMAMENMAPEADMVQMENKSAYLHSVKTTKSSSKIQR